LIIIFVIPKNKSLSPKIISFIFGERREKNANKIIHYGKNETIK
jgi:hypothetical protein